MRYVIIGTGVAGIHAAETIRSLDPQGEITMFGDERHPPYCRPMISMVLEGAVPPDALSIRGADFYEKNRVLPMLGSRVNRLDLERKTVSTKDGQSAPFDRLLIASGADPRPIKADGQDLSNIFYMRTEAHVRGMLAAMPGVRRAVVLGGGLVGFKAAYGLMRRGVSVTMLIKSGYPLSMQVDEAAGKMILDQMTGRGLHVRVGAEAVAFEGKDRVEQVRLADGSALACDLVVVGKGVLPAHGFVPRDRIDVDLGIRVDNRMKTSVSGVYAAGDVAEHLDIARRTPWVNAIWPEAVLTGRIAGSNMAGRPTAYKGTLSRNVIRIFDLDVMTAGVVNPPPDSLYQVFTHEDRRRATYRKLVFRGNILAGFAMVNRIEQGGILTQLIRSEMPVEIPKPQLADPGFNFRQLL